MSDAASPEGQAHPRERDDREVLERLQQQGPTERNLGELARLRIRYRNFPGAWALQRQLDELLQQWELSEEQLFARTRELHANGQVYQLRGQASSEQDWS